MIHQLPGQAPVRRIGVSQVFVEEEHVDEDEFIRPLNMGEHTVEDMLNVDPFAVPLIGKVIQKIYSIGGYFPPFAGIIDTFRKRFEHLKNADSDKPEEKHADNSDDSFCDGLFSEGTFHMYPGLQKLFIATLKEILHFHTVAAFGKRAA
jgi:hypothetical protein